MNRTGRKAVFSYIYKYIFLKECSLKEWICSHYENRCLTYSPNITHGPTIFYVSKKMLFLSQQTVHRKCIKGRAWQTARNSQILISLSARAIADKFIPQIGGSNSSGTSFYEIIAPVFQGQKLNTINMVFTRQWSCTFYNIS